MKFLIIYASTEGHTRKIARFVADRLADAGHMAELLNAAEADDIDLARFDRAILAASVHLQHYQKSLTDFVAARTTALAAMPTLFLSISLTAAGHEDEDWQELDRIMADFTAATGWNPGQTAQIAGAYMPSRYDIFRRFVMRRIVAKKDPGADLDRDHDYTDWDALAELADGFAAG